MFYNYNRFLNTLKVIVPVLLMIGLLSCDKFDGDQTIPAYIHIRKISLVDNTAIVGSLSSKITDAWVYIDDQFIGAFELPATFPVLSKGVHTIKVLPGIKMNGIANTRVAYPFYSTIVLSKSFAENVTLDLDSLTTKYDPNTKFEWKEDFELGGVSLQKSTVNPGSDTSLIKTDSSAYVFEGIYSGMITLDPTMNFFELETINKFVLPRAASPVFLEMDYKTNTALTIGLDAYSSNVASQVATITLLPTTTWKKIYINFTPTIGNFSTADNFRVFFGQMLSTTGGHPLILLDNIKLVHP